MNSRRGDSRFVVLSCNIHGPLYGRLYGLQCNRFSLSIQRGIQILFQRYDSGEPSGLCRGVFLLIKNIDGSLGFEIYDQLSAMQIICYRLVPFCIVLFNCVKIKSKLTMLNEKFIRSYQYNFRLFAFKFFFVYIVFTIQTLPIKIHLGHNNSLMFAQIPFSVLSQSETRTHYKRLMSGPVQTWIFI